MKIDREHDRLFKVETNNKVMDTPFFFPAITSVKADFGIIERLELIRKVGYPGFLISAYDVHKKNKEEREGLLDALSDCTSGETLTLLDSGNYESFWNDDMEWDFQKLESVLSKASVDFCFSFDVFWDEKKKTKQHMEETKRYIAMTAGTQKSGTTIPLLHSSPDLLPEMARELVEEMNPEIIGVPERELGSDIFERAGTVKRIRKELDGIGRQVLLHLLGAGNPLSILAYTICGADTYDASEWCEIVIDPETCHLLHFNQREILGCNCDACKVGDATYPTKTMAHNLLFYKNFTEKIRESIRNDKIDRVLTSCLGSKSANKIKKIYG